MRACVRETEGCEQAAGALTIFRVIVRLDEAARLVELHRVAHRAHVYRPS